jgi:hypothetical protein
MNILLLTSCNRIKQILLSLSINAQIIKEKFNVVIVDSSTPYHEAEGMCEIHDNEDPYNFVKPYNYCSDVSLLYNAHSYFPNIEQFKVIHFSPRLNKQRGESNSIALGLTQAALMGNIRKQGEENYCLKITGTSILKKDIVSELPSLLDEKDLITWHRTNIGGSQRSTRVFGCRPKPISKLILDYGWDHFIDDIDFMEEKLSKISQELPTDKLKYTGDDESSILLEGGMGLTKDQGRNKIQQFINENNINTNATPYLQEFINGGIW